MRASNRGATRLKRRARPAMAMQDFDGLPPELRAWTAQAALPWRPASVRRAFARALRDTGDRGAALAELDRLQSHLLARDPRFVWRSDNTHTQ